MVKYSKEDILRISSEQNIRFLRLQFTDLLGALKSVEVTRSQFERALDNKFMFDGSNIEGFVKIEESDMFLFPDYDSFAILPWYDRMGEGNIARLICDVYKPDEIPFEGDPRYILKKAIKEATSMGFNVNVAAECEFYLFPIGRENEPTTETSDKGGYFDLGAVDSGEECRREICSRLEDMGLNVESAHHESAPAQHSVGTRYDDALRTADNVVTLKSIVKSVALNHDLNATFMPKPIFGQSGSGMRINISLSKIQRNLFYDENDINALSPIAYKFIAGIMEHAQAMTLVMNPLVNSYRRLIPGADAPVHIAWSAKNRSSLIRIPASRGVGTRIELRSPDVACNPYLGFAVCLMAGLEGIEKGLTPPAATDINVFNTGRRQSDQTKIETLPGTLLEAIEIYQNSDFLRNVLGEHTFNQYLYSKKREMNAYHSSISQWELDNYFFRY